MKIEKKRILVVIIVLLILGIALFWQSNKKNVVSKSNNEVNKYEISKVQPTNQKIDLYINQSQIVLNNEKINRWVYTDKDNQRYDAGMPIIANVNDTLNITVHNNSTEKTNVHWHGLAIENAQDGPGIIIEPNKTHDYTFKVKQTGTFWYHSHERPVRDQVDNGMYAPLIIKSKEDAKYDQDHILVLDDWVNKNGNMGHMQVEGSIDTVNGKTSEDIPAINISSNELYKLRFIGASTALSHDLDFPVPVKVTHTDGKQLMKTFYTKQLHISPGERYDVELQISDKENKELFIESRRKAGIRIPINYKYVSNNKPKKSPLVDIKKTGYLEKADNKANVEMILSDGMAGMMEHSWTINDKVYPDGKPLEFKKDKLYTIRFRNDGMHRMDHPMHIHGAHFLIKSINGEKLKDEIWKDTLDIPHNEFIDVVIKFDNPGEWMVHCHILDHEDGGMMTSIIVK